MKNCPPSFPRSACGAATGCPNVPRIAQRTRVLRGRTQHRATGPTAGSSPRNETIFTYNALEPRGDARRAALQLRGGSEPLPLRHHRVERARPRRRTAHRALRRAARVAHRGGRSHLAQLRRRHHRTRDARHARRLRNRRLRRGLSGLRGRLHAHLRDCGDVHRVLHWLLSRERAGLRRRSELPRRDRRLARRRKHWRSCDLVDLDDRASSGRCSHVHVCRERSRPRPGDVPLRDVHRVGADAPGPAPWQPRRTRRAFRRAVLSRRSWRSPVAAR
jgi:hypothetical protein